MCNVGEGDDDVRVLWMKNGVLNFQALLVVLQGRSIVLHFIADVPQLVEDGCNLWVIVPKCHLGDRDV